MAFYRVILTQQPLVEGQHPDMDYFTAMVSSPDLDEEDRGYTAFVIPRNSLPLTDTLQQKLLCAHLCEVAIEEYRPDVEITGEEALPYLRYVYNDWSGIDPNTLFEVNVLDLEGRSSSFMWEDRTSPEDLAQVAKSYRNRLGLLRKTKEAPIPISATTPSRTPKI